MTPADVDAIRDRGRLIVGVSADTLCSAPATRVTGQIEGFDIDMVKAMSRRRSSATEDAQFRVITSAQRLPVLENHEVDLVARTFTINCDRWETIAFSAEYYRAGQKVLVREAPASSIEDLGPGSASAPRRHHQPRH